MDWTQLWTHKEGAETGFYSVLQCSKHCQVYVAIQDVLLMTRSVDGKSCVWQLRRLRSFA